ncbi:DUF748 domain-containing protein [Pseudomonas sp. WAC2]|uniref:DUF748 domain-containing protein n=1 Tax=Pseudomonas sp. WAC2 TaxID=3055057 RepID=UPI0025AECEAA|nr:DUF748 domain-containing protein [Pseudomonas sp. WAC2]MDN3237816.1 DUF748 domain-containing protein [Pseudomonas sp. WAC2]
MPKALKRAAIVLSLLLLYCLLGFLILPRVALHVANQQLTRYTTQPAQIDEITFNPFTFEVELKGFRIGSPEHPVLAAKRLYADLELNSLWRMEAHLARLELEEPVVDVRLEKDGTLNLTELFKTPENSDPQDKPTANSTEQPFPLTIDALVLQKAQVHYRDQQLKQPVEVSFNPIDLTLKNIGTRTENPGRYSLNAQAGQDGALTSEGTLHLVPFTLNGSLELKEAALAPWWAYVSEALPLSLDKGRLNGHAQYHLETGKTFQLQLSKTSLSLDELSSKAVNATPQIHLNHLAIADATLDLTKRQIHLGKLETRNLEAWVSRDRDGQLDWAKLFTFPEQPEALPDTPNWQISLGKTDLQGGRLHLKDLAASAPVDLDIKDINLALSSLDLAGQMPTTVNLNAQVGLHGQLEVSGELTLNPVTARLHIINNDIDLRLAQAYIAPYIRLEVRSGMLASDINLSLHDTAPLALSVTGQAQLTQLHTLDTQRQRDFLRWQTLTLKGISYEHGQRLAIDDITLLRPYARLIINEDLTTNFRQLLIPQPKDEAPDDTTPLTLHIGGIHVVNGSANFADYSLTPSFITAIQELNGQIGTLDTKASDPAEISLTGKVDRFAPVNIKGRLNPLDPLNKLNVTAAFRHVELTTLTPYSGKFAGYAIRKGRLDLDLNYRIDNSKLDAQNHLVLDQLELGERIDSPDAVDLPVRLAVALLKDSHGRIDLTLPVAGNLNDPNFSVAPIIWQTMRNVIARAVQSPFKMLAGLAGRAETDLNEIPFEAASVNLTGEARQSLDTLAQALKNRPQLQLDVEGRSAVEIDGPSLSAQRLEREFQTQYYNLLQRRGDKVPADATQLAVPEDMRPALLEGIYRTRLKQQPPAEWTHLSDTERQQRLSAAILDSWKTSDLLLRRLAQARAQNIKQYLVEKTGLEEGRIYLIDVNTSQQGNNGRIAAQLHLGSS